MNQQPTTTSTTTGVSLADWDGYNHQQPPAQPVDFVVEYEQDGRTHAQSCPCAWCVEDAAVHTTGCQCGCQDPLAAEHEAYLAQVDDTRYALDQLRKMTDVELLHQATHNANEMVRTRAELELSKRLQARPRPLRVRTREYSVQFTAPEGQRRWMSVQATNPQAAVQQFARTYPHCTATGEVQVASCG